MSPTTHATRELTRTFVTVTVTHFPVKSQPLCLPEMPYVQHGYKVDRSEETCSVLTSRCNR